MSNPIFWLGLSILLVAVSLMAVLVAALPALQAIARAARSLEKLADTLSREFPPTLEAIRMTGLEISELTDEITDGVQSASQVVKQVDQSLDTTKQQAKRVQTTTSSFLTGVRVAWKTLRQKPESTQPSIQSSPPPQPPAHPSLSTSSRPSLPPPESMTDYSELYQPEETKTVDQTSSSS